MLPRMKNVQKKHPGVRGKIVEYIREEYTDEGFDIIVQFTDKTAMTWSVRAQAVLEPELMDWRDDNTDKTLRRYPVLTSRR
jgi:hypothetical protein